jgi:hypothetical protein
MPFCVLLLLAAQQRLQRCSFSLFLVFFNDVLSVLYKADGLQTTHNGTDKLNFRSMARCVSVSIRQAGLDSWSCFPEAVFVKDSRFLRDQRIYVSEIFLVTVLLAGICRYTTPELLFDP